MAKTQVKNYKFTPGLGSEGNLYPNAYALLNANKAFLQAESTAYINKEIADTAKCKRDIGLIIEGTAFDVAFGSNYNALFLGRAESYSIDNSETVFRTIDRALNHMLLIPQVAVDSTAKARVKDTINEIKNNMRTGAYSALSLPNPTNATASRISAKDRLLANETFLRDEVLAWTIVNYPSYDINQSYGLTKGSCDVKYAIRAAAYDILYGGNSASFDVAKLFPNSADPAVGLTGDHQDAVVAGYGRLKTIIAEVATGAAVTVSAGNSTAQVTSGTNASASEGTTLTGLIDITSDVIETGVATLDALTRTTGSIGWTSNVIQQAKNSIVNNKSKIVSEVTWETGYTYNQAKCERDVGYIIDSYLHDIRYGGNQSITKSISYYWDQGVAQVDGNRIPEIDTHAFLQDLIRDYILYNAPWNAQNQVGVTQTIDTSTPAETTHYTPTDATYTPSTGIMTLEIGTHTLQADDKIIIRPDGITFTCALDSNATLHPYPRRAGVPNALQRDPYFNKPITITGVTATSITMNVGISSDTSLHTFSSAITGAVIAGASMRAVTLSQNTVDVLTNGITSLPTAETTGLGNIKIQGRYTSDELLLVTNTSKNEIIYNFSDPEAGAECVIKDHGADEDFPKYLQTTDAVTTINLTYNTTTHSSTDDLQIFVEKMENGKSVVTQRPYDFGTDAIERMRIAPPLSMLDADFEYGLQPTKWSAISMMRGYPSVYEIPGTDTQVLSVETDASDGTDGIGASLITVTTVSAHGFEVGTPITIKALETSIAGAARAEGSFVIISVPTNLSFQYYAKSKVGTADGEQLAAGYTQLRKGGFYTGAGIDGAEFDVLSNGSSGAMVSELIVQTGANTIPFDGNSPEVGSPLISPLIPVGSQVTNIIDNSAGGGEYLTLNIGSNANIGDTDIQLFDATGVVPNLALDRGDGVATFINNVVGSTVSLSSGLTSSLVSNTKTYPILTPTTVQPAGSGALLNIQRSGGSYSLSAIDLAGLNYEVGDKFLIDGTQLGGVTATNDMFGTVASITATGGIATVTLTGTAVAGTENYTGIAAPLAGGIGINPPQFNVTMANNAFTSVGVEGSPPNVSEDFVVNDRLLISGDQFPGGTSPANDLIIKVTGIQTAVSGETGNINTVVIESGTAPNADVLFPNVSFTTSSAGTTAEVDVRMQGTSYAVIVTVPGTGYSIGDTLLVSGTNLNGASPTNDATITIDNVGGSGDITAASISGTATNQQIVTPLTGTILAGTGALFDIALTPNNYAVTLNVGGLNFFVDQELKILGTELQGQTPANDITITITSVSGTGAITGFSSAGTATSGTETYLGLLLTNVNRPGSGAEFSVQRINGGYQEIDGDGGTQYEIGDVLTLNGSDMDGVNGDNDITITVTGVDTLNNNALTTFTTTQQPANPGTQVPLISTFTMTEATTGQMAANTAITFSAIATLEVTFPAAHGLVPGDTFITATSTDDGTNNHDLADGAFLVTNIPAIDKLRYTARAAGTITTDAATDPINGVLYARPDSFFVHRPFDGGVQLGTGGPQHGAQAIRQSKKYIRYQSGKGIMYTTGALFAPSYDLSTISAAGTELNSLITITTDDNDHGVQAGGIIRLLGVETPGYNSGVNPEVPPGFDYTVEEVLSERSFTVRSKRRLGDTTEIVLNSPTNTSPLVVAFDEAASGTNTHDIHNFFINETAPDGYAWGDINNSGSFTVDDTTDLINYLDGVSQAESLSTRIADTLAELKKRRNTAVVEDTIGAFKQEANIGFGAQMSVVAWHGATVRSGIFDDQNGIFWEFDGTNVSVNQRTGTQQVAGTIAIEVDGNLVTGTNTRFRDQLTAGDRVIIKGMTHVVTNVTSQTSCTVTPDFRGVTPATGAKMNLVIDKKVKSADFNLDTLDGNGPSGYDIDIAKMQMIGIQYSWYGAGFIDFMLRGQDGNFIFCHRMRNSNVNTEAFMRSGNLPVRYEVTNEGPPGKLAADLDASATTLELVDGSFFPEYGTVYIDNEIITFSGRSSNHLTGLTRGTTLTNFQAGAERTYSAGGAVPHEARTGVILISNTITPLISHWGSAFLTDGGFDEDRGYIFSYAEPGIDVSTTKQTAFMIRLAPSVSNAIIGDLGERELLNRAQLLLQGLEVTSDGVDTGNSNAPITGGIVVEGVLNPQNYPINPNDVGWTTLSGVAQGGQPSFAQVAAGGSVVWSTGEAATTATATALGSVVATMNNDDYPTWRRNTTLYYSTSMYEANGPIVVGSTVTGTNIRSDTTVTSVNVYTSYVAIRISRGVSNTIDNQQQTFTFNESLVGRNYAYLSKSEIDTAGVKQGTNLSNGGSVTFPANTQVNSVTAKQHGSTQFYEVQFNNSFSGTLTAGSGTVEFTFVQPPYAQPGETVFSFIATPGERATVDFSELKELTNTTLGGRGTFPNGPDVLAINVYKVGGTNVEANLILKWGEAQA